MQKASILIKQIKTQNVEELKHNSDQSHYIEVAQAAISSSAIHIQLCMLVCKAD